jgi:hypothetical protein
MRPLRRHDVKKQHGGRQRFGQTGAPVHGHQLLVDARVQQQAETAERDVRHVAQMHAGDESFVWHSAAATELFQSRVTPRPCMIT